MTNPVAPFPGITRRSLLSVGAAGVAAATLSACGGGGGGQASASRSPGAPVSSPTTRPDKLVVRTWGDPWRAAYTEGPAASFTELTGIPVQFDTADFNEMQAKVAEAVRAGRRPPVDVVNTIETSAFSAEVQRLSVPLDDTVVTRFAELNDFGRPASGSAYVNVSSYTQPIVYAEDRVQLAQGVSIAELWRPTYAGRLFVPSTSPEAMLPPVAASLGIEDLSGDLTEVWQRFAELAPNIAATGDEEEFISGVQRRQFDLGITLAATAREVPGLAWVVPQEGASLSFESVFVPAGLPEDVTYYAQVFVNEVLNPTSQSIIASALGEVPTHPQATLPAFMEGDPAFPFTPEEVDRFALRVDPELFARNRDAWSAEYAAALAG